MIRALRHRGPDDTGFYVDPGIGLANARLSIIDIEGGHQPIHNEEGTIQVTYNGEIYNFKEMRRELQALGHRFYTQSDTEVIVHSYEQFGDAFPGRLNGMFAIALWDAKKRRLILARDRMGIKPLHFTYSNGGLLFASEMKGILQAPIERAVDLEALFAVMNLGYIPGEKTLLRGVRKLPPSTFLVFENGSARISKYWEIPSIDRAANEDRVVQSLRVVMGEVARDQLVADVPVGCFLSGGLDTATIVGFASRASNRALKTFCMGFGEDTDEFRDARLIAERFGTEHEEIVVDSALGMKLYPRMIWHMESPKYNLYPWFVCELVRKRVKVCLSGNGGDEVFGGYVARYQNALRIQELSKNPASPILRAAGGVLNESSNNPRINNRLRILSKLGDNAASYLVLAGAFPDSFNSKLFLNGHGGTTELEGYYSAFFQNADLLQGLMNAELRTKLVDDLLSVDDTMSMAHSLELRVPLLDNRIVDLIVPVPWRMKYRSSIGKLLLRKAVSKILPHESLRKPKWGFSVNVSAWYQGELGELVRQVLPESEVIAKYFSTERVKRLIARPFSTADRRYHVLLWQMLGFHLWHRIFIDTERVGTRSLELDAMVT
jgi:asparagine synthase (glutamine-hydrolysing)